MNTPDLMTHIIHTLRISEWLGSISYYSLETTLADHNGTDVGVNIRCFAPNPGVLISDIDY